MRARFALSMLLLEIIGQDGMAMAQSVGASTPAGAADSARAAQVRATAGYAKLPMSFDPCFEAICAGAGAQAKYFTRGSAGTALIYAAHLNLPGKIFVDTGGNTYFAGITSSPDFPPRPVRCRRSLRAATPLSKTDTTPMLL